MQFSEIQFVMDLPPFILLKFEFVTYCVVMYEVSQPGLPTSGLNISEGKNYYEKVMLGLN